MPNKHSISSIALVAGLICLLVYLRALACDFVNLDDPDYILNNVAIRSLDWNFLAGAFITSYNGWWMPLTWISFAVDYHFWNINPLGYHLTNILLHAVNTGLVLVIADSLLIQGPLSKVKDSTDGTKGQDSYLYPTMLLLAGLLWGIHPLRVESVVWVTERKDVLNGLFSLSSIICYLRYTQKKEAADETGDTTRYYLLSLVFFILSLMAKSVSVVIPAMLLVADWYPLGRMRKGGLLPLLREKIPYLIASAAMLIATIYFAGQSQYLISYDAFPFGQRCVVSGNAIYEYCRFILFPVGILPFHMIPDPIPASFTVKTVIVMVVSCFCVSAGRRHPWLPAIWLCFIIPLVPVLAFLQNGDQAFAARFTYLPSLVPSIVAAFALAVCYQKTCTRLHCSRFMTIALVVFLLTAYVGITERLINVWKNSESLWSRVIELEPEVIAYKERGNLYFNTGKYSAAIKDYSSAITIATGIFQTNISNLFAYRGEAFRLAGRYEEAIKDFTEAISHLSHPNYYYHRGLALKALGKAVEAEADFARAGSETGPLGWYEKE